MEEGRHDDQSAPQPESGEVNNKFEPQQRSTADYARYEPAAKPPSQFKRWLIWALAVILILAILFFGYNKLLKKKPAPAKTNTTSSQSAPSQVPPDQSKITTATKNYVSQNFKLSFDYPVDWELNDANPQLMEVMSPKLSLTDDKGQKFTGRVWLVFNAKGSTNNLSSANAQRDSTKIAYTKPTQNQKANTYVSFASKGTNPNPTSLYAVYITGNAAYKAGDTIASSDLAAEDPLISYSFWKCNDASCTQLQTSIQASTWDDPNFSTPLLNILKSLVIN